MERHTEQSVFTRVFADRVSGNTNYSIAIYILSLPWCWIIFLSAALRSKAVGKKCRNSKTPKISTHYLIRLKYSQRRRRFTYGTRRKRIINCRYENYGFSFRRTTFPRRSRARHRVVHVRFFRGRFYCASKGEEIRFYSRDFTRTTAARLTELWAIKTKFCPLPPPSMVAPRVTWRRSETYMTDREKNLWENYRLNKIDYFFSGRLARTYSFIYNNGQRRTIGAMLQYSEPKLRLARRFDSNIILVFHFFFFSYIMGGK